MFFLIVFDTAFISLGKANGGQSDYKEGDKDDSVHNGGVFAM
jgi:hypothetical protein